MEERLSDEPNYLGTATLTPTPFFMGLVTANARGGAVEIFDYYGKYKRFWPVVKATAQMSKYPGTKVGALVLGGRFETLASGWNGAARGSKADEDGRLDDRATRLLWAVHAEANAIANAAARGVPLLGSTMLSTLMPCMACAKLIVQAGIRCVICPEPAGEEASRWSEEFTATRELFIECGVELHTFKEE